MKRSLAGLAAGIVLASPLFASALSVSELQVQLQALLAQVASLQAQLTKLQGGTTGTTCPALLPPYCPNGTLISRGTDSRGCSLGYSCSANTEATGPLTVSAWLSDPTGRGREAFDFGDQLVINWSAAPVSDLETNGWGIYPDSLTGIELRSADSRSAAGIRIVRTKETGVYPYVYTWNVTREGLYGDVVTPGRYYVYVNVASKKQKGYITGIAGPITIGPVPQARSVTVLSPNGGESYGPGSMFSSAWRLSGTYPSGTKVCINLTSQTTFANWAPFSGTRGDEHCASGEQGGVSGLLSNYLPSGLYKVRAFTVLPSGTYDAQYDVFDESDAPFSIGSTTSASGITVTAPNGGEQWELDTMNTVTWTPYQYNPDINPSKDVTAYLERRCVSGEEISQTAAVQCEKDGFRTLGKVQESGKASIHWYAGELNALDGPAAKAPAGEYYIRVVNNVTGATDRSDKSFSLVTKSVDLKVNGQDGPAFDGKFIYVTTASPLTVTWNVKNGTQCNLSGVAETPGQTSQSLMPVAGASGSKTVYPVLVPAQGDFPGGILNQVSLTCVNSAGAYASDYVQIDLSQPAAASSVRVTSPNGGEVLDPTQAVSIRWEATGIDRVSVALYKSEKWVAWIAKDLHTIDACNPKGACAYSWNPGSMSTRPDGTRAYKIYVTGKKIDGTGSVDDKSDTPFLFASASTETPRPVCGLFRGGTDTATNMVASPNPATSIGNTDAACLAYCKASGPKPGDLCRRGEATVYAFPTDAGPANRDPVGNVDIAAVTGAGKAYFSGWAYDPDASSAPLSVRVQKDGIDVATVTTDINAPTVNARYRITGAHRFRYYLPAESRIGAYRFFAADANTGGSVELKNSPRTVAKGAGCVVDDAAVPHSLSRLFYSAEQAIAPTTCASLSQRRTCTDGLLGGDESFQYATCKNVRASGETSSTEPLEQLASALQAILSILGRTQ